MKASIHDRKNEDKQRIGFDLRGTPPGALPVTNEIYATGYAPGGRYSRDSSFVVSMRDDAMIGVIVWLEALVGNPDESNT